MQFHDKQKNVECKTSVISVPVVTLSLISNIPRGYNYEESLFVMKVQTKKISKIGIVAIGKKIFR